MSERLNRIEHNQRMLWCSERNHLELCGWLVHIVPQKYIVYEGGIYVLNQHHQIHLCPLTTP